jgi:tRNA-2-methylthio-N6-dimethylallyladenosine synthase
MNESDSEIIRSLLKQSYTETSQPDADIVLINTCAIREAAEERIYKRISEMKKTRVLGILGCMAERLKEKMFEKGVHIVCGPDAYRDLPRLVSVALRGSKSINVQLSMEETYADITPVRRNPSTASAFLSIMRGCNNMCAFCIVPWVRGRERSRELQTIMGEI